MKNEHDWLYKENTVVIKNQNTTLQTGVMPASNFLI